MAERPTANDDVRAVLKKIVDNSGGAETAADSDDEASLARKWCNNLADQLEG